MKILQAYPDEMMMRDIVPIKLYEYRTMGKPVITTELPDAMKESGEGYGVVYLGRPEDALWKAVELIEGGMISEYGSKARGFVGNYEWDGVVGECGGLLEGLT